jgi:hypothetical protein
MATKQARLIALFLFCFSAAGYSQRVQSSCTAPDSIVNLYQKYSVRLALHHLYDEHLSYDSTNIPQSLRDTFLRSLIAIYNSGLQAADTILGKARFLDPEEISRIHYDTITNVWYNAWLDGYPEFSISQHIGDSSVNLIYRHAWGDCPAGCTGWHAWSFTIFDDCSVQYDSSFGDMYRIHSSISTFVNGGYVSITPNPASHQITIRILPFTKIEIIDVAGSILKTFQSQPIQEEIDISQLPKGIYLIRAFDKKGDISTAKFVKE